MVKKRATTSRPVRDYSKPGYPRSEQGSAADDKKSGGTGRVNYPSLEGVIINPPSSPGPGKEKPAALEAILEQVALLPPADRKKLLARLSLDQQSQKPEERELSMWTAGVTEALERISGGASGASHGPMVMRRYLAPSSCWTPIAEFVEAAGFSSLEVTKRQSIYNMLASLLVQYASSVASQVGAPLTPKFVADRCQHIGVVFETAFPGYLRAGLARVVAERLTEKRL
jgi:hypothetical protein